MKKLIFSFLFLFAFSVHLSAQVDSDPCFVLSCVLDQVDEAVVQGNYDGALTWLEKVKNNPSMRNCPEMKKGVVDSKIKDVKEKMGISSYKQCPDGNHPHLIDLGLPSGTKWACCNVDATKPEDSGGYYAWGETTTKSEYSWKTYKHYDISSHYHNLGLSICGTQFDVVHVKWGGSWQMPTVQQVKELLDKCNKGEWTTQNGVKGRKFTGPNGASIFLPAAGYRDYSLKHVGSFGGYWSGAQDTASKGSAYGLVFDSGGADWCDWYDYRKRDYGYCVRPVSK